MKCVQRELNFTPQANLFDMADNDPQERIVARPYDSVLQCTAPGEWSDYAALRSLSDYRKAMRKLRDQPDGYDWRVKTTGSGLLPNGTTDDPDEIVWYTDSNPDEFERGSFLWNEACRHDKTPGSPNPDA